MDAPARGLIRQHHSKLAFVYRVSDAVLIVAGLRLGTWAYGVPWSDAYLVTALLAMLLFYVFGESFQLYRSWRGVPVMQLVQATVLTWLLTAFGLLLIGYATKTTASFSRVAIGVWLLGAPTLLVLWRAGLRLVLGRLRSLGYNSRRVAIAGANEQGERLARTLQTIPSLGMRLVGFFDDRRAEEGRLDDELSAPLVGNLDDMIARARACEFDLVYIALPVKGEQRINELITAFSDICVSVYIVPDFFAFDLLHSRWINVGNVPTISVFESPFFGVEGWAKRLEDVLVSTAILALIAVPMLFIALGVKLSSPGPVLFKQRRYGLDGRRITVWKFRTMTVCEEGDVVVQASRNDGRVTRFGAFLRRTSLDELPQFFNVLAGNMSIVGPRPHAVAHNEEYRKLIAGYMLRHKVKPGITGWAQVNGWRGETDTLDKMQKRIEYDLWYIRSWSIWLDVKIIVKTIFNGFAGQNAY